MWQFEKRQSERFLWRVSTMKSSLCRLILVFSIFRMSHLWDAFFSSSSLWPKAIRTCVKSRCITKALWKFCYLVMNHKFRCELLLNSLLLWLCLRSFDNLYICAWMKKWRYWNLNFIFFILSMVQLKHSDHGQCMCVCVLQVWLIFKCT